MAPQMAQNAVLVRSEDLEGKCPKVVGYVGFVSCYCAEYSTDA